MQIVYNISDILIKLQQVGNVKYIGWVLIVPCSTERKIIDKLQEQAKEMEEELFKWKRGVKAIRNHFYELNYFSTLQLLTLRRELGKIKSSAIVTPDVLALLQTISLQVTPHIITEAVQKPPDLVINDAHNDTPLDIQSSTVNHEAKEAKLSLIESQLTDNQKEIMFNLSKSYLYPKLLIIKAFEALSGNKSDQNDFASWCDDNLQQFEEDESREEGDHANESEREIETSSDEESDNESNCSSGL